MNNACQNIFYFLYLRTIKIFLNICDSKTKPDMNKLRIATLTAYNTEQDSKSIRVMPGLQQRRGIPTNGASPNPVVGTDISYFPRVGFELTQSCTAFGSATAK